MSHILDPATIPSMVNSIVAVSPALAPMSTYTEGENLIQTSSIRMRKLTVPLAQVLITYKLLLTSKYYLILQQLFLTTVQSLLT